MSDWAVGDLAVCVRGGHWDGPLEGPFPQVGDCGPVLSIQRFPRGGLYLLVGGLPDNTEPTGFSWGPLWHADRFRKPDKHEACETEFVTLLQRIKRKQVA